MNRDALVERLSQDIVAYVMRGSIPDDEIAADIKPEDLDQRFRDYRLLLDLHFILKSDVVEFTRQLPKRLRDIQTDTDTVSRVHRGSVEGRINWGATVKERYSQNPRDRSLFVCENRSENYDTDENIVLKRVISIIHNVTQQAADYLKGDYDWVTATWRGEEQLIEELQRIVKRNVHVRRISDPKEYEPNERMLTAAERSRSQIYRDAASLLRTRNRIHDGDPEELESLIRTTAITPDDNEKLFELFVLFRFITTLEDLHTGTVQLNTIEAEKEEIARFDGSPQIAIYHDKSGPDDVTFKPEEPTPERPQTRSEKVQPVAKEVAEEYFNDTFDTHTGRPDVLVLEIKDEAAKQYEYLITEIKYSTNTDRIRQGIKETLEYLAFLRVDENWVYGDGAHTEDEDYFGTGYNGLLVTQDLDRGTTPPREQHDSEITVLQASEVEGQLQWLLKELFESL